jgi:hypothetical protein
MPNKNPKPSDLQTKRYPDWPKVWCKLCRKIDTWRKMEETVVRADDADGNEQTYREYACNTCVGARDGLTEEQAQAKIVSGRPGFSRKMYAAAEFAEAKKKKLESCPMLSGRKLYQVVARDIMDVLAPLAAYMVRKAQVFARRAELSEEYNELLKALDDPAKAREHKDILAKLEELYDQIDQLGNPLAFKDRATQQAGGDEHDARMLQWKYMLAAQYCDLWSEIKSGGKTVGALMCFYVCLAGGSNPCGTLMSSKAWDRLHADALSLKQRWYCRCCGGRYMTRYGCLVQLVHPSGRTHYARSEVPLEEEDSKAMFLEDTIDPSSPEDLFSRIPDAVPVEGDMLRKAAAGDFWGNRDRHADLDNGVYKMLQVEQFKALPLWPWKHIFAQMMQEAAGAM